MKCVRKAVWGLILVFILIPLPIFSSEATITLETVIGNNSIVNSAPSLIITSSNGITAFVDAANLPVKSWATQLSDGKSLFAQTINSEFQHAFPPLDGYNGAKLLSRTGIISSGDVRIEGIAAGRYDDTVDASNIILIIDVSGYRIVHLGDCGQEKLTQDQLKAIGRVDVALCAVEWNDSELNVVNKKAFKVLKQINPTLVIPTHIMTASAVNLLKNDFVCEKVSKGKFTLSTAVLSKKRAVFWGENTRVAEKAQVPETQDL